MSGKGLFQVDLRGVVDLLAHHLYSTPRVYVRELLQNAVDAIHARRLIEPDVQGEVRITPTDDGEKFLATIGRTSKRGELDLPRSDFLGQFGVGILSCFVVSSEIEIVSRRSTGEPPVEWVGREDGADRRTSLIAPRAR